MNAQRQSTSCRSNPRTLRGITGLEILVTLALVAILAAFAAPGMVDFIRNNKMSTAARQLDAGNFTLTEAGVRTCGSRSW